MGKIRVVEGQLFRFPFTLKKAFRIALGATNHVEEIILRLRTEDGHEGWGEASPSPMILGSTPGTTLAALDALLPVVLGEDPRRIGYLVEQMDQEMVGQSAAKAAVDIALHDLVGNITGEPVWRMLGGHRTERVETDFTVGMDDPRTMAAVAKELVDQGFSTIKVKVGGDPEMDVARVWVIREAVGDDVAIRIDANQGWTVPQAIWALAAMSECDVQLAEQPVAAEDIEGLARVRVHSPIPVMADEAAHSPEDALRVIRAGAADYVNIKLMKAGGLWRAREIAVICRAANIPNMIGGMVESNISATAAIHFAIAEGNVVYRDLDLAERPEAKLVKEGPTEIEDGEQVLLQPDAPGFGFGPLHEDWLVEEKTYRLGEEVGDA
ncbi:MAG: dipeptide epimerase [Candidatus Bipolaricaulota bacterium]